MQRFITFRELAGLLTARVHADAEENRIHGFVDITGTGGVSDDYRARYFAEHSFPLRVRLPAGRHVRLILVEERHHEDYASTAEGEIIINLPPFLQTVRQSFNIQL